MIKLSDRDSHGTTLRIYLLSLLTTAAVAGIPSGVIFGPVWGMAMVAVVGMIFTLYTVIVPAATRAGSR